MSFQIFRKIRKLLLQSTQLPQLQSLLQQLHKTPHIQRFQNIRGLSTKYIWSEWNNLQDCLQSHQVDVFGFVETNIPWTPTTKHLAQQQMKLHGLHSKALLSATSCDEPTLGWKQPGGVCLRALEPIVGGIETSTSDETGLG